MSIEAARQLVESVIKTFDNLPQRHPARIARLDINNLRSAVEKLKSVEAPAAGTRPSETGEMFLVVWAIEHTHGKTSDHWETFEDEAEAQKMFERLCRRNDIFSASICKPIRSTDY